MPSPQTLPAPILRPAIPADVPTIFQLIQALAAYEKLTHQVTGSMASLAAHLFGPRPYANAIVAAVDDQVVGFALFFYNYSTFLTQPGIYLEDLFVMPEHRHHGIGKALIQAVAKQALAEGCGRVEWSVLDWNEPAMAFYQRMGADILPDWRICRVTGPAIAQMANL
jgi:GNAT superfamily N-acetyltransferase